MRSFPKIAFPFLASILPAAILPYPVFAAEPSDSTFKAGVAVRVITPHPGEAARMLGTDSKQIQRNRFQSLKDLSNRFGKTWVILKGHQTLVGSSEGEVYVNSSGNPHLGQGGSGDLLSGYLAGLLAQPPLQSDPLKTLTYAVWQHGTAADLLQGKRSNWVIEDLEQQLGSE